MSCYIHTQTSATNICILCAARICRECSRWVGGSSYICQDCWKANSPPGATNMVKTPMLQKVLYLATSGVILGVGVWYVLAVLTPVVFKPPYP